LRIIIIKNKCLDEQRDYSDDHCIVSEGREYATEHLACFGSAETAEQDPIYKLPVTSKKYEHVFFCFF